MRRLRKFARLSRGDRLLALEALGWLALARVQIAVLPFRRIARRMGAPLRSEDGAGDAPGVAAMDPARRAALRAVGRAVERAARHVPWRADCLPQAMAAQRMLRRRGIPATMHFGVRMGDEACDRRMTAHAWLTVDSAGVVGARGLDEFTVVARFSQEGGASPGA